MPSARCNRGAGGPGARARLTRHGAEPRTSGVRLPNLVGLIRRRILVNYRADPVVVGRLLPAGMRPKLQDGRAVVGICLIRLEHIRPAGVPAALGVSSENAAHRIAVEWVDDDGTPREGVYIPRRDTSSRLNHLAGGRVFPGEHHLAEFRVEDDGQRVQVQVHAADDSVRIEVRGVASSALPATSCFGSTEDASQFFARGSLGYSVTSEARRLDGIELCTEHWAVAPLAIERVRSSFFEDSDRFPVGSIELDHALVMRDIPHRWREAPEYRVVESSASGATATR